MEDIHQWVNSPYSGTREGLPCPGHRGRSSLVYMNHPGGGLTKMQLWGAPESLYFHRFPGNTDSAMPGCTLTARTEAWHGQLCGEW